MSSAPASPASPIASGRRGARARIRSVLRGIAERFERRVDPFVDTEQTDAPAGLAAFCWHYVKDAKSSLVLMTILNASVALGEVLLFGFIGRIVDWLQAAPDHQLSDGTWLILSGVAVFVVLALPTLNWFLTLVMYQSLFANLTMSARWRMHRRLADQSISFFAHEMPGRVANRLMQSALAIRQAVWRLLEALIRMIVYVIGTAGLLMVADWRLAAVIGGWAAVYVLILKAFIPRMRRAASAEAGARSTMTGRIVDSYSNISTVKLFGHTNNEAKYIRDAMDEGLLRNREQLRLVTLLTGLVYLNNCLVVFAVGALSLFLWTHGEISAGAIAVGISLTLRLNQISQSIMWETSGFFENVGTIVDGKTMLSKPLEGQDVPEAAPLRVTRGEISFDKVEFAYRAPNRVIRDFSVTIGAGERVGIVGRSGAGKSTLINLLLRLYEPTSGTIRIDGADIGGATQQSVRAAIGVVSQETSLLNRSIRENIAVARDRASDEDIIAAARCADAVEFIDRLEDQEGRRGLDAHVGDRGVILSGGQRQRILLARIFLKNAPILVLDEATSALDSSAEAVIQEQLFQLMSGKTVVAIAHRLSTIKAMDRLLIIDEGRLVAEGSHDHLLRDNGLYAELWSLQSNGFIGGRARAAAN
jgi:ATP-binding cassette subfamily B multidrug efflux pump